MTRDLRFAVIGAGMAGILSAIKLREAGYHDLTVYEKADRLGGTWRENTYPGIACDVPSHLYRYSFAPSPDWSHTFSPGDEIQAYLEQVADDFDVTPLIRFGEEVDRLEWTDGRWQLGTAQGTSDTVDVVIADGAGTRLIYTEQGAFFGGDPRREIAMREHGCGEMLGKLARELGEAA